MKIMRTWKSWHLAGSYSCSVAGLRKVMYRFYSQEGEEAAKVLVSVSSSLWEHSICHQRIFSQHLTVRTRERAMMRLTALQVPLTRPVADWLRPKVVVSEYKAEMMCYMKRMETNTRERRSFLSSPIWRCSSSSSSDQIP